MPHTKDYELLGGKFRNFNFIVKFVSLSQLLWKSLHAARSAGSVKGHNTIVHLSHINCCGKSRNISQYFLSNNSSSEQMIISCRK